MIRPIKVAPLADVRMISDTPIVPNTMTQDEYLSNQFANLGSAPLTPNMMARLPVGTPSLLSDVGAQMSRVGQLGLISQQPVVPQERTAKTISQRVSGLLNDPEGGAALQGAFATLTAMGRPVKRGESRVLGAVDYGRKVYGEEMDRALQSKLADVKMMQALREGQTDKFRLLTSDEKQRLGIPAYENAQINLTTGELKFLGGGIDYAGRAALKKREESKESQDAIQRQESLLYKAGTELKLLSDAVNYIDELLPETDDEFSTASGVTGQILGATGLAGLDITEINAAYEEIKSKVGFGALQAMRDMSPTGGALGQVAVKEIEFLQADLGKLGSNLLPSTQRKKLKNVLESYEDALLRGAQAAIQDEQSGNFEGFNAQESFERVGIADDIAAVQYKRTLQKYGLTDAQYQGLSDQARAELPILSIDQALNVR